MTIYTVTELTYEKLNTIRKQKAEYYSYCKLFYSAVRKFVADHEGQKITKRIATYFDNLPEWNVPGMVVSYTCEFDTYKISFWFNYQNENPKLHYDNRTVIYLGDCRKWNDGKNMFYSIERLDKENYWMAHVEDEIKKINILDGVTIQKIVEWRQDLIKQVDRFGGLLSKCGIEYEDGVRLLLDEKN